MTLNQPIDNGGGSRDWEAPVINLINNNSIKNIAEFGLGEGSKFLKDNCELLHSIEIDVRDNQKYWAEHVEELLSYDKERFKLTVIKYEDKWDEELKTKIDEVFTGKYDLVFVDSGSHARGELVNYCFDKKIPFIVAHDTSHGIDAYGWNLIDNNPKYDKTVFSDGQGTTIWSRKKDE
jgi:hypothetical protein